MKIFFLLLFFIGLQADKILVDNAFYVDSKCDYVINKEAFTICYDKDNKIAKWVGYELTREEVKIHRKREDNFQEDTSIPSSFRATLYDYKRSGYDRGHLAPNADIDLTEKSQQESFLLSNIVPQNSELNRFGWNELEKYVRDLAFKNERIFVITGAIPGYKTIGMNKINVPGELYKIIYIPEKNIGVSFLIPNINVSNEAIFSFTYEINFIELKTGSVFFPEIKDSSFKKNKKIP